MGFMGAGKTTLGKALARDLGLSFHDLDQYIENRYMKSVSQLFALYGEQGFRRIESRLLHEVGEFEDVVVACGGSTPLAGDNMDYMLAQGKTVYLRCDYETILRRLKIARAKRPLIAAMSDSQLEEYIKADVARREPVYLRSEYVCPGDRLETCDQIAETVAFVEGLIGLEKKQTL